MARFTENRWTSAIIPALLIHIPIGTVYCWSVFKQLIADRLNASPASVEWGFSLAIFFLGMSAAFAGPMVEKNIKKSALVSMVCFVVGFAGTGVSIALGFLPGVFICYGAIMGVGLGIGYLTPVKNLMLWFSDNKGLATGIAVAGFGLAKAIASPLMEYLIGTVGLVNMFFILAVIYAVMMFFGFLLIKRPADWVYDPATSHVSRAEILRKPVFWGIWIAFYINITCGLALISQEKDILHDVLKAFPQYAGLSPAKFAAAIAGIIGLVLLINHWLGVPASVASPLLDAASYALAFKFLGWDFLLSAGVASVSLAGFYRIWECLPPMLPDLTPWPLAAALLAVQVLFVVLTTRYLKDHFALIYGALEGIARFAVTAASLSTLRPGGISSIPTEAEVLAALEE